MSDNKFSNAINHCNFDPITLGDGQIFSTDSAKTGINNNILVYGPTGSGKTWSYTEPTLCDTENRSLILSVTKHRLEEFYAPLFKERGYEVLDIDFTRV